MAVIPPFVTSPGAVPETGGSSPRATAQVDTPLSSGPYAAQAAAAGMESQAFQTTARAGAQLADYGERFADQYIKAKLNVDAANRTADLSALLHDAEFQSSKIADRDAATADFDARVGKIRDDFAAQDVNPKVRAAVDASLPNQIALRRASTQNAAFGLWGKAEVAGLITNLDQYNKQAVDAQDPRLTEQLIGQANAAIDGRVAVGALHADVAAKMKVDFGSNVYRTKIELAMAKDMATGVALYNATKSKLNGPDALAMGKMAEDRSKQLEADQYVTQNMPSGGTGGGGGDVGAVRADLEKTLGVPLKASGDRTVVRNTEVGGAKDSQHLVPGKALDIDISGLSEEQRNKLYTQILSDPRVGGIGFYTDGHLHVDTRGGPRHTWGTPPASIADQVKTWQATPAAAPTQQQAEERRLRDLRFIESVQNDTTMDPEKRARIIANARSRSSTQDGIQASQAAQAADQADQAAIAWATGKLKPGTWQQLADAFGRNGDFSKRDTYQAMADNESLYMNFGSATPEDQRRLAPFLPGIAGQVARSIIAEGTADRAVMRAEAGRTETEARQLIADPTVDPKAAIKVAEESITGYLRAGTAADIAKAAALREILGGMIEGKIAGGMPSAEAQAAMARIQEKFQHGGFTRAEAAMEGVLRKQMEHTENLKRNDPLQLGSQVVGPVTPFPFQGSPDEQAKAMQVRNDRAAWIDGKYFPGAGQRITPVFTQQEIGQVVQRLKTGSVENRQNEARRLAAILPRDQITILAKQIGGDGADGLSSAIAEAIPKYASGDPAEIEIANSIIRGANRLYESGEAGKVKTDLSVTQLVTNTLAPARVSGQWDGRDVKRQDHAIMSRYVDLMGAKDLATMDDTKLNQAMKDIVGEPFSSWSHGEVLLPKGVDSSTFNDGVAAIKPSDMPALRPAGGKAITDQMVRDKGIFATVGSGIYRVRMKDADGIVRDLLKEDGTPWVIDMNPLFKRVQVIERDPETGRRR